MRWTKIAQIGPGEDRINIVAEVVSFEKVEGKKSMLRCVLGDETGLVNAFLQDDKIINKGVSLALFSCEARVVR